MRFWSLLLLLNAALGLATTAATVHWHPVLANVLVALPVLAANITLIDRHQRRHAPKLPGLYVGLTILDPRDDLNPFAWDSGRHART